MTDYAEEQQSERQVLESIFNAEELQFASDTELTIRVEPELPSSDDSDTHVVLLRITYTPTYPDDLPEMAIEDVAGELTTEEKAELLKGLEQTGQESVGMAMAYTLSSHLKESLSALLLAKKEAAERAEAEASRIAEEAETARKRGTPVTPESFRDWHVSFLASLTAAKAKAEDERLRILPPKEREAARMWGSKPTGRQLFESGKGVDDEAKYYDEGDGEEVVEVDLKQYSREERSKLEEAEDERSKGLVLSYDSD